MVFSSFTCLNVLDLCYNIDVKDIDPFNERMMKKMEKILQWRFGDQYNGKYVICNYITYKDIDNVIISFNDLIDAMQYMDDQDLWNDYYIYHIINNYAYGWMV